jgi:hypothetical protein
MAGVEEVSQAFEVDFDVYDGEFRRRGRERKEA